MTLCQSACATAPVAVPTSIVGNQDETAILLLALANDAGDELSRRAPGGWVSMIREFNFRTQAVLPQSGTVSNFGNSAVITGLSGIELVEPGLWIAAGTGIPDNSVIRLVTPPVSMTDVPDTVTISLPSSVTGAGSFQFGQANYTLPADFERPIDNTFWDRSQYWSMRGPLSPQQWQLYKSSVFGRATIERRFRFRSVWSGGAMDIGGGGIGADGIGDAPAWRTYLSIDPTPFTDGANLVFEYVSNGWCQSATGIPQNSWRADTDVGIDPNFEYLIRLSLKYRLLRRLGLSYNEELDEYERQVGKAMATDGGSSILNLTPGSYLSLISPYQIQEGNFPG